MRKITACTIGPYPKKWTDPMPMVSVTFDDGKTMDLFTFYPDELSFSEREFIGLTEWEARALHGRKDRAYLSS